MEKVLMEGSLSNTELDRGDFEEIVEAGLLLKTAWNGEKIDQNFFQYFIFNFKV